jgi:hypothetical protein
MFMGLRQYTSWWNRAVQFMAAKKQRSITGRVQGQDTPFKTDPIDPLPQFHLFPVVYSNFESISGLNH